jgi:hypothetical protein
MMRDFNWTTAEKKIARAAFDLALNRELASVRREVESMLAGSPDVGAIWLVHDYLSDKRQEVDTKYDYRYSVLLSVFARLVREGWLSEGDLRGLAAEKLNMIAGIVALGRR